jgi:hypothetical protein
VSKGRYFDSPNVPTVSIKQAVIVGGNVPSIFGRKKECIKALTPLLLKFSP